MIMKSLPHKTFKPISPQVPTKHIPNFIINNNHLPITPKSPSNTNNKHQPPARNNIIYNKQEHLYVCNTIM